MERAERGTSRKEKDSLKEVNEAQEESEKKRTLCVASAYLLHNSFMTATALSSLRGLTSLVTASHHPVFSFVGYGETREERESGNQIKKDRRGVCVGGGKAKGRGGHLEGRGRKKQPTEYDRFLASLLSRPYLPCLYGSYLFLTFSP